MSTRKARIAADALRWYANYLRNFEGRLGHLRAMLDDGRLPTDTWGVHVRNNWDVGVHRGIRGHLPNPETLKMEGGFVVAKAPPALKAFKAAYETAHDAASLRIDELASIYADTAETLEVIADRTHAVEEHNEQLMRNVLRSLHE